MYSFVTRTYTKLKTGRHTETETETEKERGRETKTTDCRLYCVLYAASSVPSPEVYRENADEILGGNYCFSADFSNAMFAQRWTARKFDPSADRPKQTARRHDPSISPSSRHSIQSTISPTLFFSTPTPCPFILP